MRMRLCILLLTCLVMLSIASNAGAMQLTRDVKVISSAGARALVDACAAWAGKNNQIVAIAILDWGGNLIESHAMEGAPMNSIDTALLKARSALRWRRPTSETNKIVRSGENLAPTFMNDFPQPGALPVLLTGQGSGPAGVCACPGRTERTAPGRRAMGCSRGKRPRQRSRRPRLTSQAVHVCHVWRS